MMKRLPFIAASVLLAATSATGALAAEGKTKPLKKPGFTFEGTFGYFDKDQLQRGYQVYREVCANCHSMNLVAFRHLGSKSGPFYLEECPAELGLPSSIDCSDPAQNPIVKQLAATFTYQGGPDEFGDMFDRPGEPTDPMPMPFRNEAEAKYANGGAYPPDMSLLTKARPHGPDYIYSLLTGYPEVPPEELEIPAGQYYNPFYPGDAKSLLKKDYKDENGELKDGVEVPYGGVFKMAQPLYEGMVAYDVNADEDTSNDVPETVEQYSKDVVAFLHWAAEPTLEERKTMGRFVVLYLLIFGGIVYVSYRQIWRNVH